METTHSSAPTASSGTGRYLSALLPIMSAAFFLSGFSSLIYEVVWMRRLALFFD
jgi:hypothetical protein